MKINHVRHSVPRRPSQRWTIRAALILSGVVTIALAGCVSQRTAPPPRVMPQPAPVIRTAPAPVVQGPADWRDRPLTAGDWSYRTLASGSVARFSDVNGIGGAGIGLAAIACNLGQRIVTVSRSAPNPIAGAQGSVPLTLVTTAQQHPFNAAVSANPGQFGPSLVVSFAVRDATLDDLAFSRGRFAIEASGQPTLILPAWEEVGRVIEDCR
ncbi:MAG: hypothetical protein H7241_03995 [Novosphingobium sp.]|nr:hypothetical protein [Novosphingobium sp.]